MAAEPHEGAAPPPHVDPAGGIAPRAFRTGLDAPMAVDAPDLDVTRHLALAREALPPDPRDTLPSVPRLPLRRTEDVGEGERLDAHTGAPVSPRRFRTRAPVALVPRRPLPAAGEALLEGLAALQSELDDGHEALRRVEQALSAAADGLGRPAAAAPSPRTDARSAVHSVAIEMAVSGFSRGEVGEVLVRQHAGDVGGLLDEVFGPGSPPDSRI